LGGVFDQRGIRTEFQKLEQQSQDPDVWKDPQKVAEVLRQREVFHKKIQSYEVLEQEFQFYQELLEMARGGEDEELTQEALEGLKKLYTSSCRLRLETLFGAPYDGENCFLSVQAGAGGTESQDWAWMLMNMYHRWAEKKGYKAELMEETPGEETGIKSAVLHISHDGSGYPYGWLCQESGVHRLVRISPFDSNARRHTSFVAVVVSPEIEESVHTKIQDKDLRIDTYRASGAGGQHVNKTDSAVRITHLPTGIVVQCQSDRSQHRNKAMAMKILLSRIYEKERQEKQDKIAQAHATEKTGISWGRQIRSYVLHPYQMVKDLRTSVETGRSQDVLNGEIDLFLEASLEQRSGKPVDS
jgi:peptide chain release factor 2